MGLAAFAARRISTPAELYVLSIASNHARPRGVVASTLDSESSDRDLNPRFVSDRVILKMVSASYLEC